MKPSQWIGRALSPFRPGVNALTSNRLQVPDGIGVTSPEFHESEEIPRSSTADGEGRFPGVGWSDLPDGTASLVLLVEDADIPFVIPVTHLIVHSIDPTVPGLEPGSVKAFMPDPAPAGWRCGRNFLGAVGWTPPAPPPGHGMHRYAFQLFALRSRPRFRYPPHRGRLMRTIEPDIIAQGCLIGTYTKC